MKTIVLIAGFFLVGSLALYPLWGRGQMNSGMMGSGMMGGDMRGGGGMGSGMGGNSGMMGSERSTDRLYTPDYRQQNPLREDDARSILENYLKSKGNPNLRLGGVRDKGNAFEGEIVTRDNSLVDKIVVDKDTGSLQSVY